MTGFTAPPSTTDSTTHLFKCVPGQDFYHPQMEYTRACVVIRFQIKRDQDYSSPSSIYVANLQKNEDGSYSASVGVVKEDGYNDYVSKHGLHFTKALQEYASKQMVNSNNQEHTWTSEQVQNVCNVLNLKIPNTSTIEDVTYTANMAYADFYPELLNEHQCIKYAAAVANDKDGYTGIQFCRWVADVVGKKENIDWDKFK